MRLVGSCGALLALACGSSRVGEAAQDKSSVATPIGFDSNSEGALPRGWRVGTTNPSGPDATWRIVADPTARSLPNVLALTSTNHMSTKAFNVCWSDSVRFREGSIEVAFKAVAGKEDQGGGPIWRVRNAGNYYLCRMNPLEDNFRVYVVKDSTRKQLGTADVHVEPGDWHSIRIEHRGDRIQCSFDGVRRLDVRDATLPHEGGVGVWTKADAVTSFDSLRVADER